jgi:hypothetical protein
MQSDMSIAADLIQVSKQIETFVINYALASRAKRIRYAGDVLHSLYRYFVKKDASGSLSKSETFSKLSVQNRLKSRLSLRSDLEEIMMLHSTEPQLGRAIFQLICNMEIYLSITYSSRNSQMSVFCNMAAPEFERMKLHLSRRLANRGHAIAC